MMTSKCIERSICIIGVFQSMSDEVSHQRKRVSKFKGKLETANEEIQDLQGEFEQQRSDLLESFRDMDKHIRLQRLVMDRMASVMRRDCNYFNVDWVLAEAKFNENIGEYTVPRFLSAWPYLSIITL